MALLKILHFPDERLRIKAKPLDKVTDETRILIDDMLETMYAAPGVGLAAPQVSQSIRLVVIDVSEDKSDPLTFINPELIHGEGKIKGEEGCLSVPATYEKVERFERVKVRALDRNGDEFEMEADDLLSICIQHEIDHLDGKLFVDYLSSMKRMRIRKKMEKMQKAM
jgi:peptide deformylase